MNFNVGKVYLMQQKNKYQYLCSTNFTISQYNYLWVRIHNHKVEKNVVKTSGKTQE